MARLRHSAVRLRNRVALALGLTLVSGALVRAQSVATWHPFVREASLRFDVPEPWIERVMGAESAGRTNGRDGRPLRSSAGAMGLMQLMPATWAQVRGRLALGRDPDNPRDNILAGTYYLRLMYERFGYPGMFAAYNAGPQRYQDYLSGRKSLPRETRDYVAKVTRSPDQAPALSVRRSASPIFVLNRRGFIDFSGGRSPPRRSAETLFAVIAAP